MMCVVFVWVWTRIDDHLSQITDVCLLCVLSLSDLECSCDQCLFTSTLPSLSRSHESGSLLPCSVCLFKIERHQIWGSHGVGGCVRPVLCFLELVDRKCSFWMNGIKSILVFGLCCFIPLVYLRWPKVCFGWNSYFSIAKVQTSEFNQKLEFHKKKRFVRQLCSPIPGRPAGLSSRWPISRLSSLWNWHQSWVDTWCRSSI